MKQEVWLALIAAVSGVGAAAFIQAYAQRFKTRAESGHFLADGAETLVGVAKDLIQPLTDQLAGLQAQVVNLQLEVATLQMSSGQLHTAVFAVAPDPVLVVDTNSGTITEANHHAYRVFGWDAGTLVGQPIEALLPERFREHHAQLRDAYANAPRVRQMGRGLTLFGRVSDGTEFSCEVGLTPYGASGVIAHVRQLTPIVEGAATYLQPKQPAT